MSKHEKLLLRFLSKPKDFTYNELKNLLGFYSFIEKQAEGSRVIFQNDKIKCSIKLHKPPPTNILKRYQLNLLKKFLEDKGFI